MNRYDLVIIGGGISGLGVAEAAAGQGLSVAVLEASTCCSQTSNNTLRIIHGGFRYLQSMSFLRVIRSLNDQTELLRRCPGALRPLACLMPLASFGLKSRIPVSIAGLAYGLLMKLAGSPLPPPETVSTAAAERHSTLLRGKAPHGALRWHDALMSDPNMITEHLLERCRTRGVTVYENTPARAIQQRQHGGFNVIDVVGTVFQARNVVNTLGPWLDTIEIPERLRGPRPLWCKGFNLISSRPLDAVHGVALQGSEGRLFFCVPREGGSAIGTWYIPHEEQTLPPRISEEEISIFLKAFNAALGEQVLHREDIVAVDVGVLPMKRNAPAGPQLLGNEQIHEREGYIEVISTKYTTFRSQATAVVRRLTSSATGSVSGTY